MEKLYLTVSEAARYVGIGEAAIRECMASKTPPPYLRIGNTRYLQTAALAHYFEQRQEVRND